MGAFHERCGQDGTATYLETIRWSNASSHAHERFYGRMGYVVSGVVPMTDEWDVLTMTRVAWAPR